MGDEVRGLFLEASGGVVGGECDEMRGVLRWVALGSADWVSCGCSWVEVVPSA